MPELPEVETIRRGLDKLTLNQEFRGGEVLLTRTIAHPLSTQEFLTGLQATMITEWQRRGKYLLAKLSSGGWLGVHLRMTGQLLWVNQREPLPKHTRVRLFLGTNQELRFVDQRTFGQMWWVAPHIAVEKTITGLQKLGLDPFAADFSVDYLRVKFKGSRRPIKTALLDQSIAAGMGNIYADEALFLSKIPSEKPCGDLTVIEITRLKTAILKVLSASIEAGGTTFSNFLNVQGVNGNYGGVAWVYNRDGEACRVCGTIIQRIKLAGRSAHFCPLCQRENGE